MADDAATKSALLLALTPKGKPSSDDKPDDAKEDSDDAQAILDAIKDEDAGALKDALRGFVSACMADYDKDDDGE